MISFLKNFVVTVLCLAVVFVAMPRPAKGKGAFSYGKPTSDEAAAPEIAAPPDALGTYALQDTTEYDFPEEEDQKRLWRDVALWVIVAGFVAFFVIKVFLEGEKDETEEDEGGKPIPPTVITVPLTAPPASP